MSSLDWAHPKAPNAVTLGAQSEVATTRLRADHAMVNVLELREFACQDVNRPVRQVPSQCGLKLWCGRLEILVFPREGGTDHFMIALRGDAQCCGCPHPVAH